MFGNNNFNPYYVPQVQRGAQPQPQMQPQMQPMPQQVQQPQPQPQPQAYVPQFNVPQPVQIVGLQGKIVESIEVAKVQEIPMDGSATYFALADGSAIVTKQLQQDGTFKMTIYKPSQIDENEKSDTKQFTQADILALINDEEKSHFEKLEKELKENIQAEFKQLKRDTEDYVDKLKKQK